MPPIPFTVERLHHVAIPARDFETLQRFYVHVLGFEAHADKPNWLKAGDGFNVHLMPSPGSPEPAGVERHFALQVASLRDLVVHLLAADLQPYQASLDGGFHAVTDPADPLDFGIGSVFIADPENNTVEFLERGKGLFAAITG